MSVGVGLPMKGLSKSGSHKTGRMRPMLYEAWEPRAGRDPDIDRTRTPNNIYEGPRSAEAIAQMMERRVEEFSEARRAAGGRAMKGDAGYAAAIIIKPEKAWIDGLSEAERLRFFSDARATVCDLLGITPISSVIHTDEQAWHMHLAAMAEMPDGSLCYDKVFGTYGKNRLNAGFAEQMRQRGGWDITPCDMYDADKADKDPVYKAARQARRTKQGRDSRKFKSDKLDERAKALEHDRDELAEKQRSVSIERKQASQDRLQASKDRQEAERLDGKVGALGMTKKAKQELKAREAELTAREDAVTAREDAVTAREAAVASAEAKYNQAVQDAVQRALEAFEDRLDDIVAEESKAAETALRTTAKGIDAAVKTQTENIRRRVTKAAQPVKRQLSRDVAALPDFSQLEQRQADDEQYT